jgi:thiol-disulfide isomerase/thioredoxin
MKTISIAGIAGFLAVAAAAAYCQGVSSPRIAPVQVLDLAGKARTVPAPAAKATILLFVSTTCPYSNSESPEMAKIADRYSPKGFAFFFVYGNPYGKLGETKQHAREYNFDQPAIFDTKQTLVRAVGATNTPEAVVIAPTGNIVYHGRVDNLFSGVGMKNSVVTEHDLTDALDAIAAGKAPAHSFEQPIGCAIPMAGPPS